MQRSGIVTLSAPNCLPILCYHKIGSRGEFGKRFNIEPARFATHVRFFNRQGFKSVLGRDLIESWPSKSVWFTFDDSFVSAATAGTQILEGCGFRGTFFVIPGLVGSESNWVGEGPFELADWAALGAIFSKGHEIGNHTWSHADLSGLSNDEQTCEIESAAKEFASHEMESRIFCFPFGRYNLQTVEVLGNLGFQVSVTTQKRIALPSDPKLELPRIPVGFSDSLPMLLYKLLVRPRLP